MKMLINREADFAEESLRVDMLDDGSVDITQGVDFLCLSAAEVAVLRDGLIDAMPTAEKVKLRDRLLAELGPLVR